MAEEDGDETVRSCVGVGDGVEDGAGFESKWIIFGEGIEEEDAAYCFDGRGFGV